jgi:hypothetical protein
MNTAYSYSIVQPLCSPESTAAAWNPEAACKGARQLVLREAMTAPGLGILPELFEPAPDWRNGLSCAALSDLARH